MNRQTLRSALLVAASLGLATGLFFTCFERTTREIPAGYSREALDNPYLALGRLLERMGHEVTVLHGPARLGEVPPGATLLLPIERTTLGEARSEALLEWVAGGGHLVVVTWTLWEQPDRRPDFLLDRFDLRQVLREHAGEAKEAQAEETKTEAETEAEAEAGAADEAAPRDASADWDVAEAHWPGLPTPLRVEFDPRFAWSEAGAEPDWQVAGSAGTHLVQLRHGAGTLTALTDDLFLRNARLGRLDHAELALRLARVPGEAAPVWIVAAERWPGLWAQARAHAWPALVAGAVLLAAWLWRASRRFGPVRPDPPAERRRWMEHLEAAGRFHWRDDGGATLLAAARGALLRELEIRHPAWAQLPAEARLARLADLSGLAPAAVRDALAPGGAPGGEADFVARVARLERIRRSL